ncbi:cupin [Limosilactobacillus gastricus]|uniref:Protein of hypothetical function DUF985 n=1 Tax=Limosilactobacillus gastricus DSM 16045 TaxID=1423749 RepID=A0A0R1VD78_9LACO|nr:cupin domain-containing protein [Limosilactobacillus gastricus]KRM03311.1 Protein of hypothetical function DUF985 [Limosilactobacillus gastricus DSM 16045]QGF41099.1 cupin [Limosilactobacillus gastricus]
MTTKQEYIEQLRLEAHPEGGWYRQVYHSAKSVYDQTSLASRYQYTSIYFILDGGSPSHLHRLLHDEIWYYHDGAPIVVHCFSPNGDYTAVKLGRNLSAGEQLQFRVPAGTIFGSEVTDPTSFGLVSCAVAPGFDYHDFELYTQAQLLPIFPEQADIIKRLAYQNLP